MANKNNKFMVQRQAEAVEQTNYIKALFDKVELLRDGSSVVPRYETKEDVENIVSRGQLFGKTNLMREMRASQCHSNSAAMYKANRHKYSIVTGYGYTTCDSLWRQHTWLIRKSDKAVLETTVFRDAYFGYILTDDEAYEFCLNNPF